MIDLRSHILDGTPCGPQSFADSLQMCRAAIADGVRTLVATPLWEAESYEPPLPFDECQRKLERLEAEVRGALTLRLGFVLRFNAELLALTERHGAKLALARGRRLLISLPSTEVPESVERVWAELGRTGFSVLLAHPECNAVLRRDPARLGRWVAEGMALQIDAASVEGAHGREVRRFAIECLRRYEGHAVVASNARPTGEFRHPLEKARAILNDKVGPALTARVMTEVPREIIGEHGQTPNGSKRRAGRRLSTVLRSFDPLRALVGSLRG